jgi:bla regulator protein blaR1
MATWMLFAVVVGLALGMAAHFAERAQALLGRAARWPWLTAMLLTLLWPFAAAAAMAGRAARSGAGPPAAAAVPDVGVSGDWRVVAADLAGGVPDGWLLGGWLAASALLLVVLLVAGAFLRREQRRWRGGVVGGERVLLSPDTGPAVTGTLRPRIVLPMRVLELEAAVQRLIVQHEREHLDAGDSRLLGAALLLLVLLPWCLPLWWHFRRLRLAIEIDCDQRLLRAGAPPRAYAEALLTVASWRPATLPLTAMAPAKASLERRIRAIVTRRPRRSARRTLVPLAAASLVLLALAAVPVPPPPSAASLQTLRGAPSIEALSPLPDGSLPGDPGEAGLAAALAAHHGTALATGIPPGSIVWFVVDGNGAVRRTGIERGTEAEVIALVRARHPAETSDMVLAFDGVPAGAAEVGVLWMLPPP